MKEGQQRQLVALPPSDDPPTTRNREWVPSDGAPLPTPSPMEIWVQFFFGYDSGSVLSDLMNRTVFSVFSAGLSRDHIILTAFA